MGIQYSRKYGYFVIQSTKILQAVVLNNIINDHWFPNYWLPVYDNITM